MRTPRRGAPSPRACSSSRTIQSSDSSLSCIRMTVGVGSVTAAVLDLCAKVRHLSLQSTDTGGGLTDCAHRCGKLDLVSSIACVGLIYGAAQSPQQTRQPSTFSNYAASRGTKVPRETLFWGMTKIAHHARYGLRATFSKFFCFCGGRSEIVRPRNRDEPVAFTRKTQKPPPPK